jgi:hypothetical protein
MAAAQGPEDRPRPGDRFDFMPQRPFIRAQFGGILMDAVSEATGLAVSDIRAEIRAGKTLNEILADNGIDPQVVIDTVTTQVTEELAQAVESGRIEQERMDQALGNLPDALDRALNASLPTPIWDRAQERFENTLLSVIAEKADVEPSAMLRDALTPPTLAEIAESYGLDTDAIIAETEARITAEVNQRVADGDLSEEEAAELLDGLNERLAERFNSPVISWGQLRGRLGNLRNHISRDGLFIG